MTELFPDDLDLGDVTRAGHDACARPIGRKAGPQRHRPQRVRARRLSSAAALAELRRVIEKQHQELMAEVKRFDRPLRAEWESLPAVLRRLTEIERVLRLTELHTPEKATRRRPLG